MIQTKEIFNTTNGQEFVNKEYLVRTVARKINAYIRTIIKYVVKDDRESAEIAYLHLFGILSTCEDIGLVDEAKSAIILQDMRDARYSGGDKFSIPELVITTNGLCLRYV